MIATFFFDVTGDGKRARQFCEAVEDWGAAGAIDSKPDDALTVLPCIEVGFLLPSAKDSEAVQIVINGHGDPGIAWPRLRQRMLDIVNATGERGFFGSTFTFLAVVASRKPLDKAVPEWRESAGGLVDAPPLDEPQRTPLPGGDLWILDVAHPVDGSVASTVYALISTSEKAEDAAVGSYLIGPNGALVVADLIAHKGYEQMRLFHEAAPPTELSHGLSAVNDALDELLMSNSNNDSGEQDLATLSDKLRVLATFFPRVVRTRVNMAKQLHNFEVACAKFDDPTGLKFHAQMMESGATELALYAEEMQAVREVATLAVATTQADIDRATAHDEARREAKRNERDSRIAIAALFIIVAQLAIIIAQLFDQTVAGDVLARYTRVAPNRGVTIRGTTIGYNASTLFITRLFVSLCISALIGALLYWGYTRFRRPTFD